MQECECGPCLCFLSPLECVHLCVSLSPTCPSCAAPICSFLFCVDPNIFPGKKQGGEGGGEGGEGGGGRAAPEPQVVAVAVAAAVGGSWLPCRPDGLSGFCPFSAQHWGGRLLGGNRERTHGLVPGRLRGGGADETV